MDRVSVGQSSNGREPAAAGGLHQRPADARIKVAFEVGSPPRPALVRVVAPYVVRTIVVVLLVLLTVGAEMAAMWLLAG